VPVEANLARNGTLQPIRSLRAITPTNSELSVSLAHLHMPYHHTVQADAWTKTGTRLMIHPQTCLQRMTCSAARVLAFACVLRPS
jgi:hypothetical protein